MGSEERIEGFQPVGAQRSGRTTRVRGVSLWIADQAPTPIELNSHDALSLDPHRSRWTITPLTGDTVGQPIESSSPAVAGYLRRVLAEKLRLARRLRPAPGVPKPVPKPAPQLPPHTPVPCPLCRPHATPDLPGEPWPDCELCNGEGVVTARQAIEWRDRPD